MHHGGMSGSAAGTGVDVRGTVAPGFEPVRDAFVRNFEQRGERGAAVAVYRHGRKVVDLWAGTKDVDGVEPWAVDTVQIVRSAGKGIAAAVPLLLHQRGQVDLDAPVGTYWPEFKANGKERVLVRHLLAHRAAVPALDRPLTPAQAARLASGVPDQEGDVGDVEHQVGDEVEGIGPRGKITLAQGVDWHLFIGDDIALPAFASMIEALPAGGGAIVIGDVVAVADQAIIDTTVPVELDLIWRHRDGAPAGVADALVAAVGDVALPAGVGHAYVFGEASVVNAIRDALIVRGLSAEQMSVKAYWGLGRANASHGEPLRSS